MQRLPSEHADPSGAMVGSEHRPVPVSHVPARWHGCAAGQITGLPGVHAPDWQLSASVHALASSHPVPSGALGSEHRPVPESHVPVTWH